jgi:DNA-binding PadR family transcriptional regulator
MLIDRAALSVLRQLGDRELFGLELLEGSDGTLLRGSLYVHLGRMEGAGLIEGREVPPFGRRRYRITGYGRERSRPSMMAAARLLIG